MELKVNYFLYTKEFLKAVEKQQEKQSKESKEFINFH